MQSAHTGGSFVLKWVLYPGGGDMGDDKDYRRTQERVQLLYLVLVNGNKVAVTIKEWWKC